MSVKSKKYEFIPINFNNYEKLKEIKVTTSVVIEDGCNLQDIISRIPPYVKLEEMFFKIEHGYYEEMDYVFEYIDYESKVSYDNRVLKFNYEVIQYNTWCEKHKIKFDLADENKKCKILDEKYKKERYLNKLYNGE